jgi:hypothetical protein
MISRPFTTHTRDTTTGVLMIPLHACVVQDDRSLFVMYEAGSVYDNARQTMCNGIIDY